VLAAWVVAAVCVALAWRQRAKIERLVPPRGPELLRELLSEHGELSSLDELARQRIVADLNERLADVAFGLRQLPATFTALIRISLASGTALALFGFLANPQMSALSRAIGLGGAAAAGLFAAGMVSFVGRSANQRGQAVRQDWDQVSREAGKTIGASLEGAVGLPHEAPRRAVQ